MRGLPGSDSMWTHDEVRATFYRGWAQGCDEGDPDPEGVGFDRWLAQRDAQALADLDAQLDAAHAQIAALRREVEEERADAVDLALVHRAQANRDAATATDVKGAAIEALLVEVEGWYVRNTNDMGPAYPVVAVEDLIEDIRKVLRSEASDRGR